MDSNQSAPTSLKIVAGLFILYGVCSAVDVVVSLVLGNLTINLNVLAFFIGLGLLRFSRGWRTCALVVLWIYLIGLPIIALLIMLHHGPLDLNLAGQKVGHVSKGLSLGIAAVSFVLAFWQYRVLTRPDIRKFFGVDNG